MDMYELPVALPFWPRELERQFHKWSGREPWWTEDLTYIPCPGRGDEPQPGLPLGAWGRFFWWRGQRGYGTMTYGITMMRAAVASEARLSTLQAAMEQGQVRLDGVSDAMHWAIDPFLETFTRHGLGARELFHRNTRRKLERLGLLEEEDISKRGRF